MTLSEYKAQLASNEGVAFEATMQVIAEHYTYQPTTFSNGLNEDTVVNAAGTNEGSCKIFAFAKLEGLDKEQTLGCFGGFYRDVLATPQGTDHGNIRAFMKHGWDGISFEGEALTRKGE